MYEEKNFTKASIFISLKTQNAFIKGYVEPRVGKEKTHACTVIPYITKMVLVAVL